MLVHLLHLFENYQLQCKIFFNQLDTPHLYATNKEKASLSTYPKIAMAIRAANVIRKDPSS